MRLNNTKRENGKKEEGGRQNGSRRFVQLRAALAKNDIEDRRPPRKPTRVELVRNHDSEIRATKLTSEYHRLDSLVWQFNSIFTCGEADRSRGDRFSSFFLKRCKKSFKTAKSVQTNTVAYVVWAINLKS